MAKRPDTTDLTVRLTPGLIKRIDAYRGGIPRSRWIEQQLIEVFQVIDKIAAGQLPNPELTGSLPGLPRSGPKPVGFSIDGQPIYSKPLTQKGGK